MSQGVTFSDAAQSLVSQFVPLASAQPGERAVFRRDLSRGPTRRESPGVEPSDASPGHSTSACLSDESNVDLSYAPAGTPRARDSPRADAAAERIQNAWRRYSSIRRRSFCELGGEAVRLVRRYISGSGFPELAASRAHLVLHFDINKTILMSDAAKGAGQADMVNVLLSECAWGRMTEGPTWVPVGRLATDRPETDPQLMTYRNFLDSFLYPYLPGTDEATLRENVRRKRLCSSLQKAFTASGQPGAMFSGVFAALQAQLAQPDDESHAFFASRQRRILPSFFELLLHLHAMGRSFTIIFRSFGTDIADVVQEMNLFATGHHPSYPGVRLDGSDGRTDLRMAIPQQTGAFVRWGHGPEESMLALGVDARVLEAPRMSRSLLEETAASCEGVCLYGFESIYSAFQAMARPRRDGSKCGDGVTEYIARAQRSANCAYAFRDYYHFWKSRGERPRAGKLLLCDPESADLVSIFFDDNINITSAHIADARDVRTGRSVPFARAKNAFLIRAEPINAILDPKFYIRSRHCEEVLSKGALSCSAVSEAELTVLRRLERHDDVPLAPSGALASVPETAFQGHALAHLQRAHQSGVARVSLRAKRRWEWALRKVIIASRVAHALHREA